MKRIIVFLLLLGFMLCVSGCKGKNIANAVFTPNSTVDYEEIISTKW